MSILILGRVGEVGELSSVLHIPRVAVIIILKNKYGSGMYVLVGSTKLYVVNIKN